MVNNTNNQNNPNTLLELSLLGIAVACAVFMPLTWYIGGVAALGTAVLTGNFIAKMISKRGK